MDNSLSLSRCNILHQPLLRQVSCCPRHKWAQLSSSTHGSKESRFQDDRVRFHLSPFHLCRVRSLTLHAAQERCWFGLWSCQPPTNRARPLLPPVTKTQARQMHADAQRPQEQNLEVSRTHIVKAVAQRIMWRPQVINYWTAKSLGTQGGASSKHWAEENSNLPGTSSVHVTCFLVLLLDPLSLAT